MSRYKTPLRYPGGKQRLAPFIAEIMATNGLKQPDYVEPYAGGAGVAMELLLGGKARRVHLNDSSAAVYAFWRAILTRTEEFCRRVAATPLSVPEWRRQREILSHPAGRRQIDLGFSLFYLNRCNRSGIVSGGLIGGIKQRGEWRMNARFPRAALVDRIKAIAARKGDITVHNLDAKQFIQSYIPGLPKATLVYLDPPYFHKADRLYLNHYLPKDHAEIAKVIQHNLKRHWVVSYDAAPSILEHYDKRRSFRYDLQYNAAKVYKGSEVFFFSDDLKLPGTSAVAAVNTALRRCSA